MNDPNPNSGDPDSGNPNSGAAEVGARDVIAVRDWCVTFLRSVTDRDWSSPVPDLEGTVASLVGHVTGALLWYSLDLSARGPDLDTVSNEIDTARSPDDLIEALSGAAELLAAAVSYAPADARGFHPWGMADACGFAAMGCDEMLVHTYDMSRAFETDFVGPPELADRLRRRLFPHTQAMLASATAVHETPDPWTALLWANGRVATQGHERIGQWKFHPAPLAEWDGSVAS